MIARDQKQAMYASRGEDDGIGEFQASALSDEDGFLADGFIDFEQIEFIEK